MGLSYLDGELAPSTTEIGQGFTRTALALELQHRLRWFRRWTTAWAVGGVSLSRDDYVTRQTVDSDSFLQQRFENRTDTGLGLLLDFTLETESTRHWTTGIQIQYAYPFGDGLEYTSLNLLFLRD